MAYEMLAGRPPFGNGVTPMAVLYAHVHQPPPPLADLVPDAPESVRGWVEWLLAKAPEDRPGVRGGGVGGARGDRRRRARAVLAPVGGHLLTRADHDRPDHRGTDDARDATRAGARLPKRRRRAAGDAPRCSRAARRRCGRRRAVAAFVLPDSGRAPPGESGGAVRLRRRPPAGARRSACRGRPSARTGPRRSRRHPRGEQSAEPTVITPRDAGLNSPYAASDDFGTEPQSGDFDRDGWADLAIGAPGRELVAVCTAAPAGSPAGASVLPTGAAARGAGRYGQPPGRRRLRRRRIRRPRRRRPWRGPGCSGLRRDRAGVRRRGGPHDRTDAHPAGRTPATPASAAGWDGRRQRRWQTRSRGRRAGPSRRTERATRSVEERAAAR